jgi:murein DD-endopeptidase MepM/ murein hydrolase activator NlpD
MESDKKANTPNLLAQKIRHKRVFVFRFILDVKSIFRRTLMRKTFLQNPHIVINPFKRLIRQSVIIGVALLIVTSIAPTRILETGFTADFLEGDTDFLEEGDQLPLPPFLINEEGFVLKTSPISEDSSRIGFTDSVKHTVAPGDSLSGIAALYGISVKTLVWENNISESSTLKIGQTLVIPALDGVTHQVAKATETLSSIAKSYGVDAKLIKEHNGLSGDIIQKGQKLFVPGGKRKEAPIRAGVRSGGRIVAVNTFDPKVAMSSFASPQGGKELIFPTDGKITQGFRGGHYALDIGNATKPDIWAAASGTVVTAGGGCPVREVRIERGCGHGYGNYVVLDHGDGLQTLYAHLETLYVSEGMAIERGQALGKMGNTGRAYGKTGIHLHFEVFDNEVKKNPNNYF